MCIRDRYKTGIYRFDFFKDVYKKIDFQLSTNELNIPQDALSSVSYTHLDVYKRQVFDPKYNKYNFRIHDYFLAKALDQVRPGGMVAVRCV